jgi:hypothetical protein
MQGKACITGAAALDAVEGRRDAATEWAGACVHSGAGAGAVTRLQAIMLRDLRCCRNATYATLGLQTAALAASLAMHAAVRRHTFPLQHRPGSVRLGAAAGAGALFGGHARMHDGIAFQGWLALRALACRCLRMHTLQVPGSPVHSLATTPSEPAA